MAPSSVKTNVYSCTVTEYLKCVNKQSLRCRYYCKTDQRNNSSCEYRSIKMSFWLKLSFLLELKNTDKNRNFEAMMLVWNQSICISYERNTKLKGDKDAESTFLHLYNDVGHVVVHMEIKSKVSRIVPFNENTINYHYYMKLIFKENFNLQI